MKRYRIAFVAACLFSLSAGAQTVSGRFGAGDLYVAPEEASPVETSRMYARSVEVSSAKRSLTLPVTGGSGVIIWTMPSDATEVKTSLTTPGGTRLGETEKRTNAARRIHFDSGRLASEAGLPLGRHEVIHIEKAIAGEHQLELTSGAEGVVTVVVAEPDSPLQLDSWVSPMSRRTGEPVTLFARLRDESAPATASVSARFATPAGRAEADAVTLFDDGRHGDGAANDGLFAAVVTDLPASEPGFWNIRFEAEGRDAEGVSFARTGGSSFMNERDDVRLAARGVKVENLDGGVRITAQPFARREGNYRFDVIIAGPRAADGSRKSIAWSETTTTLTPGRNEIVVDIPADQLGEAKGTELLFDCRLLSMDAIGVAGRVVIETP